MIEILLISLYVVSVLLCGYFLYQLTVKELKNGLGVINLGALFIRIVVPLIPLVNTLILIAFFVNYLYNTDIKFNMKDNNGNPN